MAGEIANAFIAIQPSMRGFGTQMVAQAGPQVRAASAKMGASSGAALGASLGGAASKSVIPAINQVNSAIVSAGAASQNFFARSAQMAVKNVVLYGSMYAAIQGIRVGISSMFDNMVGFNAELEQASIGFGTLLKSSAAAEDQMAWIKDFAKETPFRYDNLVNYSQQLIALGFSAEKSREVLTAAGNAAAALGRGDQSIERINLALGQMWTKGKVQSQEMLQLTEAGIGAWQILADAYGASVADVQDRVTRGLITAKEAVPALVSGMEDQFGGLMDMQAKTFSGVWSNIQDTIQQDLAAAGEPLFDQLKGAGQEFLSALDDPAVKEVLSELGQELADTAKVLLDTGAAAAGAFKEAMPFLRDVWSNAKGSLPVLVALAAGFYALRKASAAAASGQVGFFGGLIAQSRMAAAAVTSVTVPTKAMVAAQNVALRSSISLGAAKYAEAQATTAAKLAAETATNATTRGAAASKASWAAQTQLTAATRARMAVNAELVVSEGAVTAATERAVISQKRFATAAASFRQFSGVGQVLGLSLAAAGITQLGDASADTGQQIGGLAETLGGSALAGAAFGSVLPGIGTAAGAAVGAVVGLTVALVNLTVTQDAANKDTTATAEALKKIGVQASTATAFLSHFTNEQLEMVGGSQAVVDAIQHGGKEYDALVDKLKTVIDKLKAVRDANQAMASMPNAGAAAALGAATKSEEEYDRVRESLADLQAAASDAAYSQFLAVEATNASTNSYGEQAFAAYQDAQAIGTISGPLLQTGVAAEGASGKVGYLLAALTGLPVNTPINFSTNATDILVKIYSLQASIEKMRSSGFARMSGTAEDRLSALKRDLAKSLTATTVTLRPTMSLPSGRAGRAASAAASAARAAAASAARAAAKLKRDRHAQLQFADAFGTLMHSALEGNFDRYRKKLSNQIASLARDGYTSAAATLKRLSGTLNQAALDYGALTNKIKSASDAEADLTKRMQDQYQSTVDLVMGLGKATDAQSFDQLTYLLGETTSAATQYQDVLQQLKVEGLSENLWNQLANAGPQSLGLAQSILAQGQSGVDQLNSLSGSLVGAAESMGELVSESMYKQGADAMQAYIDGLGSQASALENQLVTIGNNVLTQTAGAITPGNAGYSPITSGQQTTANTYQVSLSVNAADFGDLQSIQDFIHVLESAPTTQLVDAAGTVIS